MQRYCSEKKTIYSQALELWMLDALVPMQYVQINEYSDYCKVIL